MSQILYPPSRPLSVGETVDLVFGIFRATLVKCLPYGVVATLAGQIPNMYLRLTGQPGEFFPSDVRRGTIWVVLLILTSVVSFVLWMAMLLRQKAMLTQAPVAARGEIERVVRRLPAFIGLGLAFSIAVGCLLVLASSAVLPALLRWLIVVAVAVACSWVTVAWSCVPGAILFEGKGLLEAVRYSVTLTKGSGWRISMVYLVGTAMLLACVLVVSTILSFVVPLLGVDLAVTTAVLSVIMLVLVAMAAPYLMAHLLAVYGELLVRRQGVDLEQRLARAASE